MIVRVPHLLEIGQFDEVLRAEEQFHRECVGWGGFTPDFTGNFLRKRLEYWHGEALQRTREGAGGSDTPVPIALLPRLAFGDLASFQEAATPCPSISKLAAWLEAALRRKPISEGQLLKTYEISQNTLISIRAGHSIKNVTRIKLANAFDVENFEDILSN